MSEILCAINGTSDDTLMHIFSYFNCYELQRFAGVCQRWYRLSCKALQAAKKVEANELVQAALTGPGCGWNYSHVTSQHTSKWKRRGLTSVFPDGRSFSRVMYVRERGAKDKARRAEGLIIDHDIAGRGKSEIRQFAGAEHCSVFEGLKPIPLSQLKSDKIAYGMAQILRAGQDFLIGWVPARAYFQPGSNSTATQPIVFEAPHESKVIFCHPEEVRGFYSSPPPIISSLSGWYERRDPLILVATRGDEKSTITLYSWSKGYLCSTTTSLEARDIICPPPLADRLLALVQMPDRRYYKLEVLNDNGEYSLKTNFFWANLFPLERRLGVYPEAESNSPYILENIGGLVGAARSENTAYSKRYSQVFGRWSVEYKEHIYELSPGNEKIHSFPIEKAWMGIEPLLTPFSIPCPKTDEIWGRCWIPETVPPCVLSGCPEGLFISSPFGDNKGSRWAWIFRAEGRETWWKKFRDEDSRLMIVNAKYFAFLEKKSLDVHYLSFAKLRPKPNPPPKKPATTIAKNSDASWCLVS